MDLRSLDLRGTDPRMTRSIGDQDMRTLPGQLPNPLPPVGEAYVKLPFFVILILVLIGCKTNILDLLYYSFIFVK